MAGQRFRLQTAAIALTAATVKTLVQGTLPSNIRGKLVGWGISFDGITAAAVPVLVELLRQTTAGTMTSLTPVKCDDSLAESIQSTGQHTATVEPTGGDVLVKANVHPQGGRYEQYFPIGREIAIGGADRVGIRATAPATVNAIAWLEIEE